MLNLKKGSGSKGMSNKKIILIFLFLLGASTIEVQAQSATDVLRYSLEYPSYDAVSVVMPGVSSATGLGAYQENPASMALVESSYFSFGLSNRYVTEESTYLGSISDFDDVQSNIGDIGFVYKVPTSRGTLVVGGGYSQNADYNRAFSASARNEQSSLTDFYASFPTDNPLNEAAFEAYAIDDVEVDQNGETVVVSESIFRFPDFLGIDQNFETIERGVMGDYSAFIATEFQPNFFVGVSIGLLSGSYTYARSFLEADRPDVYNSAFIDSDGDGQADTDIDNILSEDRIDAQFTGLTARLGILYKLPGNINIGAGYHYSGKLSVDEEFSTQITTSLDNGADPFFGEDFGEFTYKIKRPDRFNVGITLADINGLTLSAAVEGVRYSQGRIEFGSIRDSEAENAINSTVRTDLEDVINLRGGLEYRVNPFFTPRIGYGYYPSPQKNISADRQFFSGGFSARVFDNVTFDLGLQYSIWEDQNQLYDYFEGNDLVAETVREEVTRWNIMAGVRIRL